MPWFRVLSRTVLQTEESDEFYYIDLELAPITSPAAAAVHYYACPYVFGDTAPGTNGPTHSYWVGDTPARRLANAFLLASATWSGGYEAFTGPGGLPLLTDGYASAYFGGRGTGTFTLSTVEIITETPMAFSAAPQSADTIVFWQHTSEGPGPHSTASIDVTVDGVYIGHFTPTWGPTAWRASDAGIIAYLDAYYGAPTQDDSSSPWGTYFDLGTLATGTNWSITVNETGRLVEIQAFNANH